MALTFLEDEGEYTGLVSGTGPGRVKVVGNIS